MRELNCRDRRELRESHRDRWLNEVKAPNEADASAYTLVVQILHPDRLVLNPAELQVEQWSQKQYTDMWDLVLLNYCDTLVVSPDWAYSSGGRLEVQRMLDLGRPVRDIFGTRLTRASIEATDRRVRQHLESMGFDLADLGKLLPEVTVPVGSRVEFELFGDRALNSVIKWVVEERQWQSRVSSFKDRERTINDGPKSEHGEWAKLFDKYLLAARVEGVGSEAGGTKILIYATLAVAMMEQVGDVFGPFPEPGVSSESHIAISQLHAGRMTADQRMALAIAWLSRELDYVREKYSPQEDDDNTKMGIGVESWWYRQLRKFWVRAHQYGLDTPEGRRQLGKFASTACGLAMSHVRLFGVPRYPTRLSADELRDRGFFDTEDFGEDPSDGSIE